jgi:ATP-dependent Clp protease ATP-binding subunit ClpX
MYLQHKVMRELCNDKTPSFRIDPVMVVGETGNGKSFMIKSFCEFMSMNYIHIDASSMVPNGIKGNSIDSMLKNIIRESKNDINKAKSYVVVLDEFDKLLYSNDVYNSTILNQLLRLIEGSEYPLEKSSSEDIAEFKDIDSLDTTYMFFILVGSFQQYKDTMPSCSGFLREENSSSYEEVFEYSQVPKELEGRIKEVIVLNKLDKNSMVDILKGESSPIKKYDNMLKYIDSSFYCDDDMIEEIATEAINSEYGARVLDQLVFSRYKKHLFGKNSTPKKQNIKDIFALKLKQQYSVA